MPTEGGRGQRQLVCGGVPFIIEAKQAKNNRVIRLSLFAPELENPIWESPGPRRVATLTLSLLLRSIRFQDLKIYIAFSILVAIGIVTIHALVQWPISVRNDDILSNFIKISQK